VKNQEVTEVVNKLVQTIKEVEELSLKITNAVDE
jgi:hypothetical protein